MTGMCRQLLSQSVGIIIFGFEGEFPIGQDLCLPPDMKL